MTVKNLFTKPKTILTWFLIIFILSLISLSAIIYIVWNSRKEGPIKLPKISQKAGDVVFKDKYTGEIKDRINVLVIGLDENRDEKGIVHHKGSRTDTIFLLNFDKNAERLGMLSIPRDTWVQISDRHGEDKINSAYTNAFWDVYQSGNSKNYERAKMAGIFQAQRTVEKFLDVKIDYYILVKIEAAAQMVDAIGGVNINVEKDMDYDDNWGNLHIHLKKGKQKLNGMQAVGYARFRHDEEGDWGRMRRQQQLIKALVRDLLRPANITRIDKIAKVLKSNLETNMETGDLIDLGRVYSKFKTDKDRMIRATLLGNDDVVEGTMIIRPDNLLKERLVKRIMEDPSSIKVNDLQIKVLNGSGIKGLGAKVAKRLKSLGYNVIDVGNAKEDKVETTKIYNHFINMQGMEYLTKDLKIENAPWTYKKNDVAEISLDFTIILGKDMEKIQFSDSDRASESPTKSEPESAATSSPESEQEKSSTPTASQNRESKDADFSSPAQSPGENLDNVPEESSEDDEDSSNY